MIISTITPSVHRCYFVHGGGGRRRKKNIKPLASFMFCLHFYQPIYFKSVSVKRVDIGVK